MSFQNFSGFSQEALTVTLSSGQRFNENMSEKK